MGVPTEPNFMKARWCGWANALAHQGVVWGIGPNMYGHASFQLNPCSCLLWRPGVCNLCEDDQVLLERLSTPECLSCCLMGDGSDLQSRYKLFVDVERRVKGIECTACRHRTEPERSA